MGKQPIESHTYSITETPEQLERHKVIIQTMEDNRANGLPANYNISRADWMSVTKFDISLDMWRGLFLQNQYAKGNAEATVTHYNSSFRKISRFMCWATTDEATYKSKSKEEQEHIGGGVPVAAFEKEAIEADFREYLETQEFCSPKTVETYFRDWRAILYEMMDIGLIEKHQITIREVETDIKEVYSDEEVSKLLVKPSKDAGFVEWRNWAVINWVLATGNRITTVCNIKIADVDFAEDMIYIQKQKNKRKSGIPLEFRLRKALLEYIDMWLIDDKHEYVSEYLFPSSFIDSNKPMNRSSLGHSIADYNFRRGVKKTSFHLFRHTFAKRWITSGGDLHMLQKILGHSTMDMVVHYANLWGTDLKPAIEQHSVLALTSNPKTRGRMLGRRKC